MAYTARRTWPDADKPDDYILRYCGVDVGRTYAELIPGGTKWRWTIFIGAAVPCRVDCIPIAGYADDLEGSKAAFKLNFGRMIEAGVVKIGG
jgi:hypothetical protein